MWPRPWSQSRFGLCLTSAQAGIEQLFNQLLRPKLRMFIPDVYKDVSYILDDDTYATAEYNDIVRKRFIRAWEGLVEGYKVRHCATTRLAATDTVQSTRTFLQRATSACSSVSHLTCSCGPGRSSSWL